jgi:hypothetical protein
LAGLRLSAVLGLKNSEDLCSRCRNHLLVDPVTPDVEDKRLVLQP